MRTLSFPRRLVLMSRRSLSSSPSRDIKRPRLEGLTPDDYKNGLMLAPMVRSGARMSLRLSPFPILISVSPVPTRLFALKHGAKLVWGPEMVDKAMLNSERVVDRASSSPRLFVWPWLRSLFISRIRDNFLQREAGTRHVHLSSRREAVPHLSSWLCRS
jgi:hypothetical protein